MESIKQGDNPAEGSYWGNAAQNFDAQNFGGFTRANSPNSGIHPFGRRAVGNQIQPPKTIRHERFELGCYFAAGMIAGAFLLGLIWGVL
jgi:hypothetical protein